MAGGSDTVSRRNPQPQPAIGDQARKLAAADGERAAQWVAGYVKAHGTGPKFSELGRVMNWPASVRWAVIERLASAGMLAFAVDEARSLRPGPAAPTGAPR